MLAAVASTSPEVFVNAGKSLATRMSIPNAFANTPATIVAFGQNLSIVITSVNASALLYTLAGIMYNKLFKSAWYHASITFLTARSDAEVNVPTDTPVFAIPTFLIPFVPCV